MDRRSFALVAASLLSMPAPLRAENVDPSGTNAQYAWSENAGWINAEPGGNGGPGLQVDDFGLTGWLWSENAGWISLSCENTGTCEDADYRVVNDGHGNLRGHAWGENTGWISFASSGGSVVIEPGTGKIGGHAWGENVGWVSFVAGNVQTGWCQSTPSAPTGSTNLRASRAGSDVTISQLALAGGAAWHEIVRGRLSVLRATGGDYAAAMLDCVGDDLGTPSVDVAGAPVPAPGDGYWYLARRANCKGKGSFDEGVTSQSGSRDAEIAASGAVCP